MRFVFRADASVTQGSGHVMRCLTLAEEVASRGHEVTFASNVESVPWLSKHLARKGYSQVPAVADALDAAALLSLDPDWVIVDSYRIPVNSISSLSQRVALLAIVDGTTRGIDAGLYLEQNLGSDASPWPEVGDRMLAGSRYALVRDDILAQRRPDPSVVAPPVRLTAFMGGTDPSGTIVEVAARLRRVSTTIELTIVAPAKWHDGVRESLAGLSAVVIEPTTALPSLLGSAHVIVSAAGTSAWDVCTLGIPAVFIGVVDNQSESLGEVVDRGLALGIDLTLGQSLDELAGAVDALATDMTLRRDMVSRCASQFDGRGKRRVVDAMERRG